MRLNAGNPMVRVLTVTLIFEAIVFALSIAGMVQVSRLDPGRSVALGGAATLLALVAAGTMRRPIGFPLGWLTQAVGVCLGFTTRWMFLMGGIFALLWVVSFVLGRRLDRARTDAARGVPGDGEHAGRDR